MDIKALAKLAKLNLDKREEGYFEKQFDETFKIIDQFENLDTSKISETYSVIKTKNIMRDDEIDISRILSQDEALRNAKSSHNGFFVVDAILDNDE